MESFPIVRVSFTVRLSRHLAIVVAMLASWLNTAQAQIVTTAPQSQSVAAGANATFTVAATGTAPLSYQWRFNGTAIAGATSATHTVANVQPANTGLYTVALTSGATSTTSSAVLGLTTTSKLVGAGTEFPDITHPGTGFIYDQILLGGPAASVTADVGQILRVSYIDLTDDIVQVEFSGAGTLSIALENASGPAAPARYNQAVNYMRGHASIVITGANETTNLSVFSVGRLTSPNTALFPAGVTYDGLADIAYAAVLSPTGKFGGIRSANTSYFAGKGITGIYAPGVQFAGPVFVGNIVAFTTATSVLLLGGTTDVRVTGGDLFQNNGQPVAVSGITVLNFAAGSTSHGGAMPAQVNLARLEQNGVTVTSQVAASGPTVVTIAATKATSDESGLNPGEFTLSRTGSTLAPVSINYVVGGSAVNGVDYSALVGFATIPAGAQTLKIPVSPNPDVQPDDADTVLVTVAPGTGYSVGALKTATVTIADSPATLYVSAIRPAGSATTSTASGTATILLSSSNTIAGITVSFSNLSSPEVSAHLTVGSNDDFVYDLPQGQVAGAQWTFTPRGTYTSAALVDALKTGKLSVRIDSSRYPSGEVRGAFVQGTGSQLFTIPPTPPTAALTTVTATDAARLLTQATFGPKRTEIEALTGGSIDTWLTAQLSLPFSSHRAALLADKATYGGSGSFTNWNALAPVNRKSAWFKVSLTADDQLRQRVAFALSQILVISEVALGDDSDAEPLAYYYDQLGEGAFGNFRTLLETVTLSPMMGRYLSSLRNSKADPNTGTTPDENYAREVMQLFTIGLVRLQPDGTLVLGADGLPIPTYNQKTVTEMAKVFTGWAYPSTSRTAFRTGARNYISPMQLFDLSHDDTAKDISPIRAAPIPAGQGGTNDLRDALDALVNHDNTGPYIAKQLIQRLVTSNPSPAYIYRVAQVFQQQKSSSTQLGAVVRAILTDWEARSPAVAANLTYGKLKEPLLRLTALLRGFNARASNGRYLGQQVMVNGLPITGTTQIPAAASSITTVSSATLLTNVQNTLAQAALRSPTVFNFYHPDYVLPGPLAAAGLVVPEFEITDDNFAITVPNAFRSFALANVPTTNAAPSTLPLDLAYELTLVSNPAALVDHLNTLLAAGNMSAAARTRIVTALTTLPTNTTSLERAQTAVFLAVTSPAAAVQK